MKLGAKQELFASLIPDLFDFAIARGYGVRPKELLRTKEQAAIYAAAGTGILNSLHCKGLAIDLVLTKSGVPLWLTKQYHELGEFWESLHELCSWGGRFGDGMHFSVMHRGVR
jgi:hypothetical protein